MKTILSGVKINDSMNVYKDFKEQQSEWNLKYQDYRTTFSHHSTLGTTTPNTTSYSGVSLSLPLS